MPAPVVGGPASRVGGGVTVEFFPPVDFIVSQANRFQRALLTEMDQMYESFRPVLGAMMLDWFGSEGEGSWPPLAPSTVAQKGHSQILIRTGALMESLVDPGRALRISGVTAEYGTDVEYAHWHQDGGSIAGRPPVREVIPDPFPVDKRQELERLQVKWIDDLASKTWGRI